MLRFYFIRHGQTLSNIRHTLQGWSDTPLTSLGVQQGKQTCERLQTIPFLAVYSSPSTRAYETAKNIVGDRKLEIIKCDGLKEMNFGSMEGQPEHFAGCSTSQERICYHWQTFGGENIKDVTKRIKQTMDELVSKHHGQNGNILCVSHGFSILAAIRAVDEQAFQQCLSTKTSIKNCSGAIICWDKEKFSIESINEI